MTELPTFLALLAVAYVVPGPDFAFVMSSATRSTRLGRAAAGGVISGVALQAVLAAAGVSGLLAASPTGLMALRVLGTAFLIWMAAMTLHGALRPVAGGTHHALVSASTAPAAWLRGLLGNLLNPKSFLFFIALIPQFVDPARPLTAQVAALSAITVAAGIAWWTLVVHIAGRLATVLAQPDVRRRVDVATGVALLALAGAVAAL